MKNESVRSLWAEVVTAKLSGEPAPKWFKIVQLYPCPFCKAEPGQMCQPPGNEWNVPTDPPFHISRVPQGEGGWWNYR